MTAWRTATAGELEARNRALASVTALSVSNARPQRAIAPAGDLSLPEVQLIRGDAVVPEPLRWLWDGWLAAGKLHILAGSPGAGKTTLALAFAATVSRGGTWPDGTAAKAGN